MLKSVEYVDGLNYIPEIPNVIKNLCEDNSEGFIYLNTDALFRVDYINDVPKCQVVDVPETDTYIRLDLDNGESLITYFDEASNKFPTVIAYGCEYLITGKKTTGVYSVNKVDNSISDNAEIRIQPLKTEVSDVNTKHIISFNYFSIKEIFVSDEVSYRLVKDISKLLESGAIEDLTSFKYFHKNNVYFITKEPDIGYRVYAPLPIPEQFTYIVRYQNRYSVVKHSEIDFNKLNVVIDNINYPIVGLKYSNIYLDKPFDDMLVDLHTVTVRKARIDTFRLLEPRKLLKLTDAEYSVITDFTKNIGLNFNHVS